MPNEFELTASQQVTFPTICEAQFQESVELFWLPLKLFTLHNVGLD